MTAEKLEILFQDDERANGVIVGTGNVAVPWTAIKSPGRAWYVVLHGTLTSGDHSIVRLFESAIRQRLALPKAA